VRPREVGKAPGNQSSETLPPFVLPDAISGFLRQEILARVDLPYWGYYRSLCMGSSSSRERWRMDWNTGSGLEF